MLPSEFRNIVGELPYSWPDDIGRGWLKMKVPLEKGPVIFSYKKQPNKAGLDREFYRTVYCGEEGGSITLKVSDEGIVAVLFANSIQTICPSYDFTDGEMCVTVGSAPLESGEPVFILDYSSCQGEENIRAGVFCSRDREDLAELSQQAKLKRLSGEGIRVGGSLEHQGKAILEMLVKAGDPDRLMIKGLASGWPPDERGIHFVNLEARDYSGLALGMLENFGTTGGAVNLQYFLPDFFNKMFLYQ